MPGYDSLCCFRSGNHNDDLRVLWELNTQCNLHCVFCHTYSDENTIGLPTSEFEARMEYLKTRGVTEIIFSGGEPLLRPDIFDILHLAQSFGFSVDLCTNGTLITEDIAGKLAGILDEISISIDSADPAIHDTVRGVAGAHKLSLSGIAQLKAEGIEIHAITMIDRMTYRSLPETIALLERLQVQSVSLIGRMQTNSMHLPSVWRVSQNELVEFVEELRATYRIPINTKRLFFRPSQVECPAGRSFLSIDATGRLLPCILMKNTWSYAGFANWREIFAADKTTRCDGCMSFSSCQGGCPAAGCVFGLYTAVDVLCERAWNSR